MATLLEGNTATLGLSNSHAIRVKIVDEDTVQFQYIGDTPSEIKESPIIYKYIEDDLIPAFTDEEMIYYLSDFVRDNIIAV